jgi:hypothetical protein
MRLAPRPNSFDFFRATPVALVYRFGLPLFLARCFAGFPAANFGAEPLVMMITGISGEPFFAAKAFAATVFVFHTKHHHLKLY